MPLATFDRVVAAHRRVGVAVGWGVGQPGDGVVAGDELDTVVWLPRLGARCTVQLCAALTQFGESHSMVAMTASRG